MQTFKEHEARLARELGMEPTDDLLSQVRGQDDLAGLYDKLTPAQLLDLYHNDHDKWNQIMSAVESVGSRKLFSDFGNNRECLGGQLHAIVRLQPQPSVPRYERLLTKCTARSTSTKPKET